MIVSSEPRLEGGRAVREIGKISAASSWAGKSDCAAGEKARETALARLIAAAKDIEADAIIGLNYEIDGVVAHDLAAMPLERVQASGIAVKLARAA